MGLKTGAGAAALAMLMAGTTSWGGSKCARPDEVTAIQVASIQQELMVAALTCSEVSNFNAFQTGYGPELRASDTRLQRMFQRLYGFRQGEGEYHAFKTRLANNSSMRSIRNNPDFCKEARQVFAAALVADKPALAVFVSGVQVYDNGPVDSCEIRVATGLAGARTAPNVVPRPNPLRLANLSAPEALPTVPGGASAAAPASQAAGN
jgi:hypothetical protein